MEAPSFTPGLLVLGSVPSIIRCWLNDNFKHDSLLYAAVCTGSHGSYLDERLVAQLGYSNQVREESDRKIKLHVYFPEATTRGMSSSRPSSPSPQLPSITVDFTVVNQAYDENDRAIQIFIGSDVLRAHSGDVLFSSNTVTLYDDDRCKLSIPMVRPENDRTFKSLRITSVPITPSHVPRKLPPLRQPSPLNGLRQTITNESSSLDSPALQTSPRASLDDKSARPLMGDDVSLSSARPSLEGRPSLGSIGTGFDTKSSQGDMPPPSTTRSTSSSSNIWGSWRQGSDTAKPTSSQNDAWSKAGSSYQRREQGIKVLRPTKAPSRTVSANLAGNASSPSPVPSGSQSRFFPAAVDGSRRTSLEAGGASDTGREKTKDVLPPQVSTKTKSANPVGGASAFSWLSK
jgi:ubiquitin carboxyl-terminal hydrolase 4/11/15